MEGGDVQGENTAVFLTDYALPSYNVKTGTTAS